MNTLTARRSQSFVPVEVAAAVHCCFDCIVGDRSHRSLAVDHHSCSADPRAGRLMVAHSSAGIAVGEGHNFADIVGKEGRSSADIAGVVAHHIPGDNSVEVSTDVYMADFCGGRNIRLILILR